MVEGTDQIFAVFGIDAGFAAHRTVHHREQACRDLNELHTAPHRGRRKACEITDHTAAQCDHAITAFDLGSDDGIADRFKPGIAFGFFPRRHHDVMMAQARLIETLLQRAEIQGRHMVVGDDHAGRMGQNVMDLVSGLRKLLRPDIDEIGAIPQADLDLGRLQFGRVLLGWHVG